MIYLSLIDVLLLIIVIVIIDVLLLIIVIFIIDDNYVGKQITANNKIRIRENDNDPKLTILLPDTGYLQDRK